MTFWSRLGRFTRSVGRPVARAIRRGEKPAGEINNNPLMALAIGAVALVGGVLGIIFILVQWYDSARHPDADDVSLIAESNADYTVSHYVLPGNVDLSTIPLDPNYPGCTPETLKWLRERGTVISPLRIKLENLGDDDEMTRVANLQLERTMDQAEAEVSFIYDCPSQGSADGVTAYLSLGETQSADRMTVMDTPGGPIKPVPVAFNLASGEHDYVDLHIAPGRTTVTGNLVMDIGTASDTTQATVSRQGNDSPTVVVPGLGADQTLIVSGDGGHFSCRLPSLDGTAVSDRSQISYCPQSRIRKLLAALPLSADALEVAATLEPSDITAFSCDEELEGALSSEVRARSSELGLLPQDFPSIFALVQAVRDHCGTKTAADAITQFPLSDSESRQLMAAVNPGTTDDAQLEEAATRASSIADRSSCDDAEADAAELGSLWSSVLGAVFASHPQFEQIAIEPVKTITERCGRQYAYDVIVHTEVIDVTWRALTDVADNPQHY